MQRIQIIGPSGSGKTTLAEQLSSALSLPHYEMDLLFWLPEWKQKPKDEYIRDVTEIAEKQEWILCGDYMDKVEGITVKRADTVVWLNYSPRVYLTQMVVRTVKRFATREKLWGHSRENILDFFFRPSKSLFWITVRLHRREGRRRYEKRLQKYGYSEQLLEFKTPKETQIWLKSL